MNRKISLGTAIALIILAVTVTVSITMVLSMRQFNQSVSDLNKRQAQYAYLSDIDKAIRQHYYGTLDEEKLHAALAKGMVNGLGDPYAAYLTAAEYQQAQEALTGKKNGIGLEIAQNADGQIIITHIDTDSPAQKVGLTVGSVILKVDETAVEELSFKAIEKLLRESESVVLTIRLADNTEAAYKLSPAAIETTSVTGRITDRIGYIRIRAFSDNTPAQFRTLYDSMTAEGAVGFIFDLRDNRGGSVDAMTSMLNYLLPSGQYGTITDGKGNQTVLSADGSRTLEYSSVTLINQNTAGEAEMFANVLSQFVASSTVGTTTAGRACVQSYYTNSVDGSVIKLTTGMFGLPNSNNTWEGIGLTPVMEVPLDSAETDLGLIAFEDDNQIAMALRLLEPAINDPDNRPIPPSSSTDSTTSADATTSTSATDAETPDSDDAENTQDSAKKESENEE